MIRLIVPPNGSGTVIDQNGRTYNARMVDGDLMIDLFPREARNLLTGRNGLDWIASNPDALRQLAEMA
jgi:hypothetical protein